MPARRKTAAELIRQRPEEARRFLESPEAKAQEEAARLVAAYRTALDALTETEGVEKVQPRSADGGACGPAAGW